MANDIEKPGMTPGEAVHTYQRILKSGDEAWEKWIDLGYFVVERTHTAAAKAGATRGTTYSAYLQKQLGQFTPIYQKLSGNGTLTNLMKCMARLDEVTAFRNRMKTAESASEPPSHPQRMWTAFEASQMSSITFEDEGDEGGEIGKPRKAHAKVGHNTEKELLAVIAAKDGEIARLNEMYEVTGDPDNDAARIWRRLVDAVGHERAVELGRKLVDKLTATIRRVTDQD